MSNWDCYHSAPAAASPSPVVSSRPTSYEFIKFYRAVFDLHLSTLSLPDISFC